MKKILYIIALVSLVSCSSAYYRAWEKLGYEKRDILSSRVVKARDSQEDAKEQFKTALEKFGDVVKFDGGNLEKRYNVLSSEFENSEASAKDVRDRINSVEKVAEDLFDEWERELADFQNANLKKTSATKLRDTQNKYQDMIRTMRKAESKIDPVLLAFRDQVLFLKHNLNAKAISSLQDETLKIETDVARLVSEMEKSISEADEFISSLS